MELKLMGEEWKATGQKVLIVPLWNWNGRKQSADNWTTNSSNRTFMELKFTTSSVIIIDCSSSNRTFMELK